MILFQKLKKSGTEMRLSVFGKFDEPAIDKGEMVGVGLPSSSCKPATNKRTDAWWDVFMI